MSYQPAGFFLARTPLLPVDAWHAWTQSTSSEATAHLERLVDDPMTKEALFLASRSLWTRAEAWRAGKVAEASSLQAALGRYLTRMATRCTPFAMLAGVALGKVANDSSLAIEPRQTNVGRLDLDLDVVEEWLHGVVLRRRDVLVWRPNPTLWAFGHGYRFSTRTRKGAAGWRCAEAEIQRTASVEALLVRAARKGLRTPALRGASRRLADRLIDAQVLVSELSWVERVSIDDPISCLPGRLHAAGLADETEALSGLLARITDAQSAALPRAPHTYQAIERAAPWYAEERPALRVDLIKRAPRLRLSSTLCDELAAVGVELARMQPRFPPNEQLRRVWSERYGEREVPFREAADAETGIFRALRDAPPDTSDRDPRRDAFLRRKLVDLATEGASAWHLSDAEVARLVVHDEASLPTRMELVGLVCGQPGAAEEPFLVFHRGRGLHGSLLGRFTRLGRDIADAVRAYVHEEEPNTVFADIDLLPAAAMAASISRVSLHPARITYDDRRMDGGPMPIRPDDLRIQLDRGRFRVLSTALGCQVALRLTHSHAFWTEDNPPGYRLLGHLARHPDRVGLVFPWGDLENTRWLPRVTRGRHVVSVARWTFDREEIAAWFTGDRDLARGAIARARLRYSIPRHIVLAEGDHLLAMDLESDASVLACARALPAAGDVTLFEALGIGGDAAASGPEGRFACEVVVPFRRVDMAAPAVPWRPMLSPSPKAVRSHPPGGEWTYLKLYSGARSADRLLTDLVAPLVADVRRELGDVPWFFVRHADPDDHLRVRVRTRSPAGARLVLERLTRRRPAFERDGSLLRTTLDTYDREVERYGGFEAIERAERVFHRDSEACVQLLSDEELDLPWDPGARWLAALLSLYRFLHLLPLSTADRLAWLAAARASTWKLSGFPRDYEGELSRRFRAHRTAIERFLAGQDARARRVARMLDARDPKIATELQAIARVERAGRTTASLGDIARSLGHLLVTRMMRAPARGEELRLLDALHRHERSVAGRARAGDPIGQQAPAAPAPGTGARRKRA